MKYEHRHIPHKHPEWNTDNYQCVCGFKTTVKLEFDKHLEDNDKKSSEQIKPLINPLSSEVINGNNL